MDNITTPDKENPHRKPIRRAFAAIMSVTCGAMLLAGGNFLFLKDQQGKMSAGGEKMASEIEGAAKFTSLCAKILGAEALLALLYDSTDKSGFVKRIEEEKHKTTPLPFHPI